MNQLVEELFVNLEEFLWVDTSPSGGRLHICSIDPQGEAIKIGSQIAKLRQFTRAEEEMLPRRTNPLKVEKMMEDFKIEVRNEIQNALASLRRNLKSKDEYEEVGGELEAKEAEGLEDEGEERFLRVVVQESKVHKVEVLKFSGWLNLEDLID